MRAARTGRRRRRAPHAGARRARRRAHRFRASQQPYRGSRPGARLRRRQGRRPCRRAAPPAARPSALGRACGGEPLSRREGRFLFPQPGRVQPACTALGPPEASLFFVMSCRGPPRAPPHFLSPSERRLCAPSRGRAKRRGPSNRSCIELTPSGVLPKGLPGRASRAEPRASRARSRARRRARARGAPALAAARAQPYARPGPPSLAPRAPAPATCAALGPAPPDVPAARPDQPPLLPHTHDSSLCSSSLSHAAAPSAARRRLAGQGATPRAGRA
jgi:hypothetical protein